MTAVPTRTDGWVADRFGVHLHTDASAIDWDLPDLVGLALRKNPRRAHLLVSSWLGKHVPVAPALIRGSGQLLGLLVVDALGEAVSGLREAADALHAGDAGPVTALAGGLRPAVATSVFGFAETATGLGHCVAEALHPRVYLHSTRREVDGVPVALRFEEGHSHATAHLAQPFPGDLLTGDDVLVLVDDELSTGTTAMAAITALHAVAPRRRYVVAALIDLRSAADVAALDAYAARLGIQVTVVALAAGRVDLPAGLAAEAADWIAGHPAAPSGFVAVDATRVVLPWPVGLPEGGRHGMLATEADAFDGAVAAAVPVLVAALPTGAARVLVVGTEEFMYLPLRLADALTVPARAVRFQTTTRSPVHPEADPGYPVRRAFRFASPEPDADGVPRHLYNADWDDAEADAVVVVVDAAADTDALSAPDGLLAALGGLGVPLVLAVVPGADPQTLGARS